MPAPNIVSVIVGIVLWRVLSASGLSLPTPPRVVERAGQMMADGTSFTDLGASLTRVLIGFALGTLLAIPVGFLMGGYAVARGIMEPWIQFFRTIPSLAIIPLVMVLMVLMGIGEQPKIFVIFLAASLSCVISTCQGVVNVD